jgi:hypothetical protein
LFWLIVPHSSLTITCFTLLDTGQRRITDAGLMTAEQYYHAEKDLIGRLQLMREKEIGHVEPLPLGSSESEDALDDPVIRSISYEREKAQDEFRIYCNIVKPMKHSPRSYVGPTLSLRSIQMGKVGERGDDIQASPGSAFVPCNLADFVHDDGRFDLVAFLGVQKEVFPTLHKLAVCLSSIRTNEVGCERFFSTAGYVSCPRRTSLKVRNYECLATLKVNMQHVFIDEQYVVRKYLEMEAEKSWDDLETADDMLVLNLERQMQAESLGVSINLVPGISDSNHELIHLDDDEELSD